MCWLFGAIIAACYNCCAKSKPSKGMPGRRLQSGLSFAAAQLALGQRHSLGFGV